MRRTYPVLERARLLLQPFSKRVNLDVLLAEAHPSKPLADRVDWHQDMIQWLRSPFHTSEERASLPEHTRSRQQRQRRLQTVRLRYCLHILDRNPEWKINAAGVLRSILLEASAADLFSSTGLFKEGGFFSEASNRIQRKFLPAPVDVHDFALLFVKIFKDDSDPDWIRGLPLDMVARLVELMRFGAEQPEKVFEGLREAMIDSLLVLAPDIAATGLLPELRIRMDDHSIIKSPFSALNESLLAYVHVKRGASPDLESTLVEKIRTDVDACHARISEVYRHLEQKGVSVALVYKLEKLTSSLTRVRVLVDILNPTANDNSLEKARNFTAELVDRSIETTKLRRLFGQNMDLISRKVVERVGFAGDHYIATNAYEYWKMLLSAAGGGIVTVFTTVFKFFSTHAGLPLFFEGFFSWLNYSGSFIFMQAMHFSLATKQPSMTATALANKLVSLNHRRQLDEFVDEVTRITRTQLAAALGNVGLVIPGALIFNLLYAKTTGHALYDPAYAMKTIKSFNPFTSVTVPAAALTGVILWLSAVIGGWLENWAVFRRMPEAIATNRLLHALFNEKIANRISKVFSREIAGIGSNVSIGFLLAFTPIIGKFFGLPIDIRHVTLSSGSLAFSMAGLKWSAVSGWDFGLAVLGIFLILLLNFGVAYSLALFVALRARRIKRVWIYHLLKAVWRRLRTRGLDFILPR